jgi:hypothetical protein
MDQNHRIKARLLIQTNNTANVFKIPINKVTVYILNSLCHRGSYIMSSATNVIAHFSIVILFMPIYMKREIRGRVRWHMDWVRIRAIYEGLSPVCDTRTRMNYWWRAFPMLEGYDRHGPRRDLTSRWQGSPLVVLG